MTDVKDSMPVLERFVVLMSYHTNRSMMPEIFWLLAHKGRNLENLPSIDHVLFHHTKRVAYKDGQYLGQCLEWRWSRSESDAWKPLWST